MQVQTLMMMIPFNLEPANKGSFVAGTNGIPCMAEELWKWHFPGQCLSLQHHSSLSYERESGSIISQEQTLVHLCTEEPAACLSWLMAPACVLGHCSQGVHRV